MESQNPLPLALQRLDKFFSQGFNAAISLDRDEKDGYRLIVTPETPNNIFSSQSAVYNLLPSGSRWTPAIGWHSYVGIPFPDKTPKWIMLGAEAIVKHDTRGAYPLVKGYVFSFPLDERILGILEEFLKSLELEGQKDIENIEDFNGLWFGRALEQKSHTPTERYIIRQAVDRYKKRIPFMFRTLILSENEIPSNEYPYDHLIATVNPIFKSFSQKTQWNLRLKNWIGI